MEFIKLFTAFPFRNEEFALCLNHLDIKAKAVGDGVVLDRKAVNDCQNLPMWVWMNQADINSPFHTRPATANEVAWVLS